jgi:uncharacterized protein
MNRFVVLPLRPPRPPADLVTVSTGKTETNVESRELRKRLRRRLEHGYGLDAHDEPPPDSARALREKCEEIGRSERVGPNTHFELKGHGRINPATNQHEMGGVPTIDLLTALTTSDPNQVFPEGQRPFNGTIHVLSSYAGHLAEEIPIGHPLRSRAAIFVYGGGGCTLAAANMVRLERVARHAAWTKKYACDADAFHLLFMLGQLDADKIEVLGGRADGCVSMAARTASECAVKRGEAKELRKIRARTPDVPDPDSEDDERAEAREHVQIHHAFLAAATRGVDELAHFVEHSPGVVDLVQSMEPDVFCTVAAIDVNLVKALLQLGFNLENKDERGQTALARAAHLSDEEIVAALLEAGADPRAKDNSGRYPIHHAALNISSKGLKLLCWFDRHHLNSKDGMSLSPLALACLDRNPKHVQTLIEYKADVDTLDLNGESPLRSVVDDTADGCFSTPAPTSIS